MADTGWLSPSTEASVTDAPHGSASVSFSTGNAGSSNDTYDYANAPPMPSESHGLKCTTFGASVPGGATINGIEVKVECKGAGAFKYLRIVKGGSISTDASNDNSTATTGSDVVYDFGGAADLWGETWTDTDINASTFGVSVGFDIAVFGSIQVDHVQIKVHYTSGDNSSSSSSDSSESSSSSLNSSSSSSQSSSSSSSQSSASSQSSSSSQSDNSSSSSSSSSQSVVDIQTVRDTFRDAIVFFEGTDSSPVDLVDASSLSSADVEPRLTITQLIWNISGSGTLKLSWDGTPDKVSMTLNGGGKFTFNGFTIPNDASSPTGDLLVSKENFGSGDTYEIVIHLRKVSGYVQS